MLEVKVRKKLGVFAVDVAFSSGDSGITAIFGPSGAGKTSIINMVAGLLRPDEGKIYIDDEPLFDSTKAINIPPNKRRLGYIFQDGRLFPHLIGEIKPYLRHEIDSKEGSQIKLRPGRGSSRFGDSTL